MLNNIAKLTLGRIIQARIRELIYNKDAQFNLANALLKRAAYRKTNWYLAESFTPVKIDLGVFKTLALSYFFFPNFSRYSPKGISSPMLKKPFLPKSSPSMKGRQYETLKSKAL